MRRADILNSSMCRITRETKLMESEKCILYTLRISKHGYCYIGPQISADTLKRSRPSLGIPKAIKKQSKKKNRGNPNIAFDRI